MKDAAAQLVDSQQSWVITIIHDIDVNLCVVSFPGDCSFDATSSSFPRSGASSILGRFSGPSAWHWVPR